MDLILLFEISLQKRCFSSFKKSSSISTKSKEKINNSNDWTLKEKNKKSVNNKRIAKFCASEIQSKEMYKFEKKSSIITRLLKVVSGVYDKNLEMHLLHHLRSVETSLESMHNSTILDIEYVQCTLYIFHFIEFSQEISTEILEWKGKFYKE